MRICLVHTTTRSAATITKKYEIQPSEFINKNKLLFAEGSAIKYIVRHQDKRGKEDLEKAKHFIDMIIERDYS